MEEAKEGSGERELTEQKTRDINRHAQEGGLEDFLTRCNNNVDSRALFVLFNDLYCLLFFGTLFIKSDAITTTNHVHCLCHSMTFTVFFFLVLHSYNQIK